MFPATTALVAHHFGRLLLQVAQERIEREGVDVEIEAIRADTGRRAAQGQWPS